MLLASGQQQQAVVMQQSQQKQGAVKLQVQIVAEEKTVKMGDGYGMQVMTRIAVWLGGVDPV